MGQSGGALGILRRLGACLVSDRIHVRMTGQAPGAREKTPERTPRYYLSIAAITGLADFG